jgi:DNA transformation protein
MRVSPSFQAFALDQLGGVRDLRARAMFGGIGLYSGEHFFGLIAADTLYLKVDDSNRKAYEVAGSRPFQPYADRPMTMPYYDVPASVIEDASTLVNWARDSIAIASASRQTSPKKRRRDLWLPSRGPS